MESVRPTQGRTLAVMEELMKFTLLVRDRSDYLTDRYSGRKSVAAEVARLAERAMKQEEEATGK